MKTKFTLLLSLILCVQLIAQQSDSLAINNINAAFFKNGSLFQTGSDFGKFTVNGTNLTTIFNGSLWMGGMVNNSLRTAVQTYYLFTDTLSGNSNTDFSAGPIADSYTGSAYNNRYNRVWHITKDQIAYHRANYNQPNYVPEGSIINWPGNGNPSNGEALLLAPFYDINQNDIYEPLLGEYPNIRGDEAIYVLYNEENRPIPATLTQPLRFEVHLMAYAYDSISSASLHNTIFLHYRIFNRSSNTVDSLVITNWLDFDIGNAFDDITGSDSTNSLIFCYNGDDFDNGGFGLNPPAIGLLYLNPSMGGHMYYNNSAGGGSPVATTDPSLPQEYYHYMTQRWLNGNPLVVEDPSGPGSSFNGDGYVANPSLYTPTRWAYEESKNWYESPTNQADKRNLISTSPISLAPGSDICLDMALIYGRDLSKPEAYAAVDIVKNHAQGVKQHFNSAGFNCMGTDISIKELNTVSDEVAFYPNPFSLNANIKADFVITELKIFDVTGQVVTQLQNIDQSELQLEFSKNQLKPGVYFLSITGTKGNHYSRKIMVKP